MDYLILITAGIISGLFSSLFGLGGGLVLVPALVVCLPLLGVPQSMLMHVAIGTSLAIMFVNSVNTVRSHQKSGNIIWSVVWKVIPYIIGGTIIGSVIAFFMSTRVLMLFFITYLLFIIIRYLQKMNVHMPVNAGSEHELFLPPMARTASTGVVTGIVSACIGGGSSLIMVPFLKHCGCLIKKAAAIASTYNVFIALIATISYSALGSQHAEAIQYATGFIYWPAFLWIVLASFIGVPIGTYLANTLSDKLLSRLYVSLLVVILLIMTTKLFY